MTNEEYRQRLIRFANQLVLKRVPLPLLRRPNPESQFSSLIESVDHLLTESHRQRKLLLPNLAAFNNKDIGVFSDYSGEGSGRYFVYSVLVCGMNMRLSFENRAAVARAESDLGGKEIAFKDLNMGQMRRTLPGFLEAADQLPGFLCTVAVEKGIRSVFGSEVDASRQLAQVLEDAGVGSRPPKTAEKMMRVVHLVSYLTALLGHDQQNIFWMTDNDEICPTPTQHHSLLEVFARVLPLYRQPNSQFGIIGGATPFEERDVPLNDLLSLPDLVAGTLGDYLTKRDQQPDNILVKEAAGDIFLWLTRPGVGLKKSACSYALNPMG
jgi:hypothetical protein